MTRDCYNEYIRRFNMQDPTVFEEFLTPNVYVLNGTLELRGVESVQKHYARIWHTFRETLHIERFVANPTGLAVQMWAQFMALQEDPVSPFGAVRAGERFDFHGLVLYTLEQGRFREIRVAYNHFVHTDLEGRQTELGIPH
jgi:predicted ester cyclase